MRESGDANVVASGTRCPETGLPVVQKPEWVGVSFGGSYTITVSVIGDTIVYVRPSGKPDAHNIHSSFAMTDQIIASIQSTGSPVILIEDFSNLRDVTIKSQRIFAETVAKREQLRALIFCGVSKFQEMTIKLAYQLSIVQCDVRVVEDYAHAINLARELEFSNQSSERVSIVEYEPERDSRLPTGLICPISELPIKRKPEWENVDLGDGYYTTYSIIGDRILLCTPRGVPTRESIKNFFKKRAEILAQEFEPGHKMLEMRDYSLAHGAVSMASRDEFVKGLRREQANILGFIAFQAPMNIALAINVGRRLHHSPFPMFVGKDYADSMKHALLILQQNEEKNKERVGVADTKGKKVEAEWSFQVEGMSVRIELLDGDVFHAVSSGVFRMEHVEHIERLFQQVIKDVPVGTKKMYFMHGLEGVTGSCGKARKRYIDTLQQLWANVPFDELVFYGANRFLQASIMLAAPHVPYKIRVCSDVAEAIAYVCRLKKAAAEEDAINQEHTQDQEMVSFTEIQKYVDELVTFLGEVNWEIEGIQNGMRAMSTHPFVSVFEAVALMKMDLDSIFRERDEALAELKRSQQRYRELVESIEECIWEVNSEWQVVYISPRVYNILGHSPVELVGTSIFDLVHPENHEHMDELVKKLTSFQETVVTLESMCLHKNGHTVSVESSCKPFSDVHGVLVGFRGVSRDTTKRKQAEQALAQSERQLQAIVNNSDEGIFIIQNGVMSFVSPRFEEMSGYASEELLNKRFAGLIYEADREMVCSRYEQRIAGEDVPNVYDFRVIPKDGNVIWVQISIVNFEWEGKPATLNFVSDITERKNNENKLRESEERFRFTLSQAPIGITQTSSEGLMIWANPKLCEIWGYEQEELLGQNIKDIVHEEDRVVITELMNQMSTGEIDTYSSEQRYVRKDGRIIWGRLNVTQVRYLSLDVMYYVAILEEITPQKEAEANLIHYKNRLEEMVWRRTEALEAAKNQAEEANASKSEFLSSVSHELRTPLTSVLGFAEMIQMKLKEKIAPNVNVDDEKVKNALTKITRNVNIIHVEAHRLTKLIDNVLDITKLEAGKVEWRRHPQDIGRIIEHAVNSTAALYDPEYIQCKTVIQKDLPLVTGDRDRLVQLVINLISNAVKFMDKGELSIRASQENGRVRVCVSDTGIGIAPEDQVSVFTKFKQVGDTLTEKPKGTGLGLAICKEIVDNHNGNIWVESELGKGSSFYFSLPI